MKNSDNKIKRRSFFVYGSAAIAALYAIGKIPFNTLRNKISNQSSLKIRKNPLSVRRENHFGG